MLASYSMLEPRTGERHALLGILTVAIAVRTIYLLAMDSHLTFDSGDYLAMSDAILHEEPFSKFPNGLPLLLAGITTLFGEAARVPVFLGLNVILGSASVFVVWRIVRENFDTGAALLAATLLALWPTQVNAVRWVMSDIPASFLVLLGLWMLLSGRAFVAGLALGAAVVFRTANLIPIGLLLALFAYRRETATALMLLASAALVVAAEKLLIAGGYVAPAIVLDQNLLIAVTSNSITGIDYTPNVPESAWAHPLGFYLQFAIEHPGDFIAQRLASLWEFAGPWPMGVERETIERVLIGLRFPLFLIALAAPFVLVRRDTALILLTVPAGLAALYTGFFSVPRFALSAEPPAICLAAAAITTLLHRGVGENR